MSKHIGPIGEHPSELAKRDRGEVAEEYRSVVAMIQDTGRNVWVIHGSYLVLVGLIAKPFLDGPFPLSPGQQFLRGAIGLALTVLWGCDIRAQLRLL